MKISLIIICLLFSTYSFGQSQNFVDSLSNEICITLGKSKDPNDSIKVHNSVSIHLHPIFEKMKREDGTELWDKIYFRLQKNCELFWKILKRNSPETEHWQDVRKIPESKLTEEDYLEFKTISSFKYIEPNGDTVHVSMAGTQWNETFSDHSFSQLNFKWLNESSYELSFIKSNNKIRKGFSNPGDKYSYYLIDKGTDYYLICTGNPGGDRFSLFKLFY